MSRRRLSEIEKMTDTHIKIRHSQYEWVRNTADANLSELCRAAIDDAMDRDPALRKARLVADREVLSQRLTEIDTEIQSADSEREKNEEIKATAPAEAPVEKKIVPEARVPEWMAKLKKALVALNEKDRKDFLEKHAIERVALVGEEKALAMLAELDANNGKIPESSPNGGV